MTGLIRIRDLFRVSVKGSHYPEIHSYSQLTKGAHDTSADVQKGIWAYKPFREPNQNFRRIPALLLHSNPIKEGSEFSPWVDLVEPDAGYAIYNGDNKRVGQNPFKARGNGLLLEAQQFYSDPSLRKYAPPILLFTQRAFRGNRKGYREFSGYGVPTRYRIVSQRAKEKAGYFTNLVIELLLMRLDEENEVFDWNWIDARRNANLGAETALSLAPVAWKLWVREGELAIERCRRRIVRQYITSPENQSEYSDFDRNLLDQIVAYFKSRKHAFEGLASLVAQRVIGPQCARGWVTKRSGDGGIDFVSRLHLGSDFSSVPVVVLGQAKCQRSVGGKDLARLVARLQRGWIGVFVTTGVFSRGAQEELYEDRYPLVLVNGKRLALEVRLLLNSEGITLTELLDREVQWYESHVEPLEAGRILNDMTFSSSLPLDITNNVEVGAQ